ncbi:MAG: NEL-type E3 ubiquitin ligase domain-containing protein [Parachlamydiales bacterium]
MTLHGSSSNSSPLSVYQHLFRLHGDNPLEMKVESLNALPESFRQQIFYNIWKQAGKPPKADYGKVHVFDSFPKLQQAVANVAIKTFQSLSQEDKIIVAWKICDHNGRPFSEAGNWEEEHAADDIPCLIKTMHDSLGDLTPELQKILDEWVKQENFREKRAEARSEIFQFLKDPGKTELSLRDLLLESLPPIFDKQPFISRLMQLNLSKNQLSSLSEQIGLLQNLRMLDLKYNQLSSLPGQIGLLQNLNELFLFDNRLSSLPEQIVQLQNLEQLYLGKNQLSSLPEQIVQLQKLRMLDLTYNQLSSLPEQFGLLQNLKELFLFDNRLSSLPEQIVQLQNLEKLYLQRNQLSSLPEQIGLLQNLEELYLYNNQLSSLPEQIGQLQKLEILNLTNNPTLQSLPNSLLNLNHSCEVNIESCGFSEHVRTNLQQICNAPDYHGPRISFSMNHLEQHHNGELKALPTLIAELFFILEKEPTSFPQLEQLEPVQKDSIRSWLSRLSDTADYNRKGEFQKSFVKQIVGYLQEANDDPLFQEAFLNIIADATETCGDRISLSILHVGIASRLRLITDIQELRKFLIGTVWPVYMLEEIARKKTETLRFFDEIEVYLGYPIMLREKLGLEIAVQDMLYFRCSALNQSDLEQAAEFVMQQQNDDHAVCAYLASREDWINALKAQYPDRCKEISEENYLELEGAGENQDKLDQLETNQKQRWEALTAWALVDLNP